METYADYNFYKNTYKGTLDESLFNKYAIKASLEIKKMTQNRATKDVVEVKMCMCELIDLLNEQEAFKNTSLIASEKVDNHTVTFKNKSTKELNNEVYNLINGSLGHLGLLYGGVCTVY